MSSLKKINVLLYLAVIILVIICSYFVYQTILLKEDISNLKNARFNEINKDQIALDMARADSLLLSGNYRKALTEYEKASKSAALNTELKKTVASKLLEMEVRVNRMASKSSESEIQKAEDSLTIETPDEKVVDSLSFALEKAQMQLSSIKKQMQQKSFGRYLTFKSSKGNRLHYIGGVKNKKANGYGIAILDSGSRYEGDWKDNNRHGQGTFYWIDGEHYEGTYKDDLRSGQGTYYWTNGEKYVGNWEQDKRNGRGTFYGKDGKVLTSGIWKDDELVEEDK